jgi:hypothetical protein
MFVHSDAAEAQRNIRVALMDLAVDDNSYGSAQAATRFSSLVQIQLGNEPGIEWVERAQLEFARKELQLSEMDLLSATADIRRGKWVKAEWLITGRFSLDDQSRRVLSLEITELSRADVLASDAITLDGMATTPMIVEGGQVPKVAAALRRLIVQARDCATRLSKSVVVAPLFFVDTRNFGSRNDFESLKFSFYERLEQLVKTNTRFKLIHFPKAHAAMDEVEMLLDGYVATDSQSWESPADIYVWGTYSGTGQWTYTRTNGLQGRREWTNHKLSAQVWDGRSAPVPVELECTTDDFGRLPDKQALPFWERLQRSVEDRASRPHEPVNSMEIRREIADSLVKSFVRIGGPASQPNPDDASRFVDNVRMIETACFFDPGNHEAEFFRITSRWGSWLDYGSVAKNLFLSKWRRSNAWGKYVDRFGLEPEKFTVQIFNYPRGIPEVYVESLASLIRMFPGESDGLGTEKRGFPKDMPDERIAEWKAQLKDELAERKRKVAAIVKPSADTNTAIVARVGNVSNQVPTRSVMPAFASNRVPAAAVNVRTSAVSRIPQSRPVVGTNRTVAAGTAPQTRGVFSSPPASPLRYPAMPTPSLTDPWRRRAGVAYTNLFQLEPPDVWPVQVFPEVTAINFPAHFETKTILKIVPWRDQLILLVLDERSSPTSDPNPDILDELLTKAGRLWTVLPGQSNPRLLQGEGMPKTIFSFLTEKDRIWVAGNALGYLDLKEQLFHLCQRGETHDAPEETVITSSGGKIYMVQSYGLLSFDPDSSQWNQIPGPAGRPLAGTGGVQSSLIANDKWLCFATGGVNCFNFVKRSWTNVPGVSMIRSITAEKTGFWMGGRSGLHFYDPDGGVVRSWRPPMGFPGLWNDIRPPNLKLLAEAPGDTASGFPGSLRNSTIMYQAPLPKGTIQYPRLKREPWGLNSHIPGFVTSLAKDGDRLWLAIADRILLVDLPSQSVVAFCSCAGKPIASLGVSDQFVWASLAFGEQLLVRVPKREFEAVPKDRWTPLTITAEERQRLIGGMSVMAQAIYAFYAGDPKRIIELLGSVDPAVATPEQMMLLAVTYDSDNADDPKRAKAWCERIISRYPGSPWATFAHKTIEESAENHVLRQHDRGMLANYDRNHDGILDKAERKTMEDRGTFKREQKAVQKDLLDPQLEALMGRYDRDGDGKLGRQELQLVKTHVTSFLNLGPENFANKKIYVTPLLSRKFPSVDVVLSKYDLNKDGALDLGELKAFALDLQK